MSEGAKILEDDCIDVSDCPNCGSSAVGYDGTDDGDGFFECFQCDHNWS